MNWKLFLIFYLVLFSLGCVAQRDSVKEPVAPTNKLSLIGNLHPVLSQHVSYSIGNYTITDYQVGDVPIKLNPRENLLGNDMQTITNLQVIGYGEIKNMDVQVPVDKRPDAPTKSEVITYFDPEGLSKYEFYRVTFPENVTLQQQFELNITLINRLSSPLTNMKIRIKNEGLEPKEYVTSVDWIDTNSTKEISIKFKAIKFGYHRFNLEIEGGNTGYTNERISVNDDSGYRIYINEN